MNVYFVSGLGANKEAFKYISLPDKYIINYIEWKQPDKNESLESYAERMSSEVNILMPFILVGLSFGGIIVQEMNRFIQPVKTILISSIKDRVEMPLLLKFSSRTSIHKVIPIQFFTNDKLLSYSFFRNIYYTKKKAPDFNSFFTNRDPYYLRWSINKIVNWKSSVKIKELYHIHGDNDVVFPHKKLKGEIHLIPKGSHIMIMQRAKPVNEILNKIILL